MYRYSSLKTENDVLMSENDVFRSENDAITAEIDGQMVVNNGKHPKLMQ